jgi:undecaprenyl pyrophosphate phosphatase UppP
MNTGKLPVGLPRGEHEVMLVFNGTSTDASTFSLKELQFFQNPDAASFSWALFLPAMTGAGLK